MPKTNTVLWDAIERLTALFHEQRVDWGNHEQTEALNRLRKLMNKAFRG